jgi:two-component system chemotaxis response regulator CheB
MPVVMCSSLARRSSELVMECLRVGAVSVVPKPHQGYPLPQMLGDLRHAVVAAASAKVRSYDDKPKLPGAVVARGGPSLSAVDSRNLLIAIGSSTGGTGAVEEVLSGLPAQGPPVVIAQHLPEAFVGRFVERLDGLLPQTVHVAKGGELLLPGHVYVAPATHHLKVIRRGVQRLTKLVDAERVNFHRPSVDVLFHSVAEAGARSTVAVMLTGMGRDGAKGMLAIRQAGGATLAQDEATCVVYGMPRAAVELGAVDESLALSRIAARVMERAASLRVAA